jgi:hypothetical protein
MGNITETTHFENLQADLEADVMDENMRWVDELTEASYESEVDLDRDIPFDPDEVDVITDHLDEVTEVEQLEADVELYYEGLGHS